MALDKLNPQGAGPIATNPNPAAPKAPGVESSAGAAFREALEQATTQPGQSAPLKSGAPTSVGAAGLAAIANAVSAPGGPSASSLKFSAHAVERMRSRGISFPPETMKGIEGAVAKAAQKGSKDTLVLAGDNALIVSVKNNTVVTVMDKAAMRENVFTNIDSTVVI